MYVLAVCRFYGGGEALKRNVRQNLDSHLGQVPAFSLPFPLPTKDSALAAFWKVGTPWDLVLPGVSVAGFVPGFLLIFIPTLNLQSS